MAARLRTLLPLASLLLAAAGGTRCELSTAPGTGTLRISGTLHFLEADGGCWQLAAADGRVLELHSGRVPETAFREGARVTLVGTMREDAVSVCQGGTVFEVERMI